MSITPSFFKKIFSILIIAIFSISLLFFGLNNLQPKTASALVINKCLAADANAKNNSYYNYNAYNSRYNRNNYANQGCDIVTNSIGCLLCNCNNGVDCSNNVYPDSSSIYCPANGAYYNDINSYNNSCYNNQQVFNNYAYNSCQYNNCYNNCINCFEQAITQLQNGIDYNPGNASINYDLLNNITNSQRSDIPTSVISSVNGNTATTEVRNYNGGVLTSTSFSIDERGNTNVNSYSNSSVIPSCYRNYNLYVCDSISTLQIGNQLGSYGTISTGFKSTFTIPQNQNYNNYNVATNYYPTYDYYGNECVYSLFGCSY